MVFCTSSGLRIALNSSRPDSLADCTTSVPAPMMRSKTLCLNRTSLIASSGISMECFAIQPSRWINRSVVTTKYDVSHQISRRTG